MNCKFNGSKFVRDIILRDLKEYGSLTLSKSQKKPHRQPEGVKPQDGFLIIACQYLAVEKGRKKDGEAKQPRRK
jgi:hypothetical protein